MFPVGGSGPTVINTAAKTPSGRWTVAVLTIWSCIYDFLVANGQQKQQQNMSTGATAGSARPAVDTASLTMWALGAAGLDLTAAVPSLHWEDISSWKPLRSGAGDGKTLAWRPRPRRLAPAWLINDGLKTLLLR